MRTTPMDRTIETVFRVLLSSIFLISGIKHVTDPQAIALRLSQSSWSHLLVQIMPLSTHAFLAGLVLLGGGLGLFFGSKTRYSALALISVLLPITVTVQMDSKESLGPLFKNIAILGGLIFYAHFGTRGWSVDQIRWQAGKLSSYFSGIKILILVLTSLFLLPNASESSGTKVETNQAVEKNVAILVREPRHIEVAIDTLLQSKSAKEQVSINRGSIVVCGKSGVTALVQGSKIQQKVASATANNIDIIACGLSLKENKISEGELISAVKVVENGLAEMIRLQSKGFISIEI